MKEETIEAYLIAENLYKTYKDINSKHEIINMIMEALRPIRFNDGNGYIFCNNLSGKVLLYPTLPSSENSNILNLKDSKDEYVVKGQNRVAKKDGEGFVIGYWPKPNFDPKTGFKKISYIKYFKPYNIYFGAGIYVEEVEETIKKKLLQSISQIRFGQDGYIFVNRLNGDALVSNGKILNGEKKLWEEFDKNPQKTKELFDKEYKAATKQDGDYIYYSFVKLINSKEESPKVSFVYGIPSMQWLVGAGVYLDDIDVEIDKLLVKAQSKTIRYILLVLLATILIVTFFLLVLNFMQIKMKKDIGKFQTFFKKAAVSNDFIDISKIQFKETEMLARSANQMLQDKIKNKHEIEIANEKLDKSNTRLKMLNTIIRHDLSNDFIVIQSAVKIFEKNSDNSMLNEINKRVTKSLKTISDYKKYELFLESTDEFQVLEINEFINNVVIHFPKINFQIEGKCKVFADDSLDSVFTNLINNSVIHGNSTQIDIIITSDSSNCRIVFKDNGTGIPDKIISNIFDEGYIYGKTGNSGIGLFIVKQTIKHYGGSISVKHNQPTGVVFIIDLKKAIEK